MQRLSKLKYVFGCLQFSPVWQQPNINGITDLSWLNFGPTKQSLKVEYLRNAHVSKYDCSLLDAPRYATQ